MSTRQEIIRLGEQLAAEDNAAHDLWTWLPSHKVAERHHGDYADSVAPAVEDVLKEAAIYIHSLKRIGSTSPEDVAEEREWFERCPCGEDHEVQS
jgi:hypothetical protein